MRRFLDMLYLGSGVLAAFFLAAICLVVLAQVGANIIDAGARFLTGEPIGLVVPSYAEFAGFFLAATSFLALPYTLRAGEHIRVSLFISHLSRPKRRMVELWCSGLGTGLTGYFTWYMVLLVGESLRYGDVSPGMAPVALWIPQSTMVLGLFVLTISFADEFIRILSGLDPVYLIKEDLSSPDGEI